MAIFGIPHSHDISIWLVLCDSDSLNWMTARPINTLNATRGTEQPNWTEPNQKKKITMIYLKWVDPTTCCRYESDR